MTRVVFISQKTCKSNQILTHISVYKRTYAESWNYNHVPVQELYSTTCGQFVVFYFYQRCSGLTLKSILQKYFKPHAKIMNNVLVRDFVKMLYQFSAKVMDSNFRKHVVKEIEFKYVINNFVARFLPSWQSSHQTLYISSLFIDLQLCIITQVIFICSNIKMYIVESLSPFLLYTSLCV